MLCQNCYAFRHFVCRRSHASHGWATICVFLCLCRCLCLCVCVCRSTRTGVAAARQAKPASTDGSPNSISGNEERRTEPRIQIFVDLNCMFSHNSSENLKHMLEVCAKTYREWAMERMYAYMADMHVAVASRERLHGAKFAPFESRRGDASRKTQRNL